MGVSLTFLGHAGFLVSDGEHTVAIDPFLTGNPVATITADQVKCDAIALTHGHEDHAGDAAAIAKQNDATIYAAYELATHFGNEGCKVEPGNPGGKIETAFGYIAFTQAFHSSSFVGQYMGMPCGVIVHFAGTDGAAGKTIYHTGDTALFGDMKLIGEIYQPDVACICIGDRFTMGPELGAKAAELIAPSVAAVPCHYKTWPLLAQSAEQFTPTGVTVKELAVGELLTLD